jgi:hypothetical protein
MKKSTLIAVVVFAALLAGVIWVQTRAPERGITRISFAEVDATAIDRIEITGKNPVKLKKDGELWRVESGKEADAAGAKRAAEAVPQIQSTDFVTKDSARFAELEVDDEKGARVAAYAKDQKVAEFVVGKSAKGGSHVRVGDEVYLVQRVYASTFSREASQWLERKLFTDKLAEVTRVEVALQGKPAYALLKKDSKWELEDAKSLPAGFRFDANSASSLASSLLNARADEVLDADPGVAVTKLDAADVLAFVVEQGEGETKTTVRREIKLGAAKEDKKVFAQVTGKPDVVTLAEYTAKSLRKAPTDFRDLKMITLDTEKVVKLSMDDGKNKLVLEKQGTEWKIASSTEKIPDDFSLDPAAVTRRLSAVANARGAEVVEGMSRVGMGAVTASVTLEDKKTVSLVFGREFKKEDGRDMQYAMGNADNLVYAVTKWTRENVTGGLKSFKKSADPSGLSNIDPKALQNLPPDVRAGLMQQMEEKKRQQEMIERFQRQAERKAKMEAKAAPEPSKGN